MFRNFGITANRGLAYCDNKLFLLTLDMRLIAINPSDGSLAQQVKISDAVLDAEPQFGYSETMAPTASMSSSALLRDARMVALRRP